MNDKLAIFICELANLGNPNVFATREAGDGSYRPQRRNGTGLANPQKLAASATNVELTGVAEHFAVPEGDKSLRAAVPTFRERSQLAVAPTKDSEGHDPDDPE